MMASPSKLLKSILFMDSIKQFENCGFLILEFDTEALCIFPVFSIVKVIDAWAVTEGSFCNS